MFKSLLRNKKAQQTAEYALLISLVVAAVVAMQTYAQRAIQARIRDASQYMTTQTSALGNQSQYEPYYASTNYVLDRRSNEVSVHNNRTIALGTNSVVNKSNGFVSTAYNGFGLLSTP